MPDASGSNPLWRNRRRVKTGPRRGYHMPDNLMLHFLRLSVETHSPRLQQWLFSLYHSTDQRALFPEQQQHCRILLEEADSPHRLNIPAASPSAVPLDVCLTYHPGWYEHQRFYSAHNGNQTHQADYDLETHTLRMNIGSNYLDDKTQ